MFNSIVSDRSFAPGKELAIAPDLNSQALFAKAPLIWMYLQAIGVPHITTAGCSKR
ncbi:MAG: hypothetical protein KME45_22885 [Stenomitos rutilans HA7619-LM2]|nr:hypothetical protein [Stenomitos rutilans HA7619-LM2]